MSPKQLFSEPLSTSFACNATMAHGTLERRKPVWSVRLWEHRVDQQALKLNLH
jgi:hypothetical protein